MDEASRAGRSLRTPPGVDLPIAWALRHDRAVVGFSHGGRSLGWHAYLVGDDDRVLLSFPWYDTAWQEAVRSCRRGRPRPVGERRDTAFEFRSRTV